MAKKKITDLETTPEIMEESTDAGSTGETTVATEPDLNEILESMDAENDDQSSYAAESGEDALLLEETESELDESSDDVPTGDTPSEDALVDGVPSEADSEQEPEPSFEPKRRSYTKKADAVDNDKKADAPENPSEDSPDSQRPVQRPAKKRTPPVPPVLTIESRADVETQADREDTSWHEIHNAYRTRKILTGTLGGIEQTDTRKTIAIVYYKEFRVIIPMKEMMINLTEQQGQSYEELMTRQNKILGNMLGAEIDFVVKGIDSKTRSVVASRMEAMYKKRQLFYLGTDAAGMYRIYEGRVVQARVIAVADKVIRIEAFGVECSIMARDLSWDWIGDAHERFAVGDQILVRIQRVRRDSLENISIAADVRSVSKSDGSDNLKKCRVQGKYAGKVTDVHKGTVYIRLSIGVNAIAHSCYDNRMPGKKDDVSFAVTHLDEERNVAMGIITRIIRQNL